MVAYIDNILSEIKSDANLSNNVIVKSIIENFNNKLTQAVDFEQFMSELNGSLKEANQYIKSDKIDATLVKITEAIDNYKKENPYTSVNKMFTEFDLASEIKTIKESEAYKNIFVKDFINALTRDMEYTKAPSFVYLAHYATGMGKFANESKDAKASVERVTKYVTENRKRLLMLESIYKIQALPVEYYGETTNTLKQMVSERIYRSDVITKRVGDAMVRIPAIKQLVENMKVLESQENKTFDLGTGNPDVNVFNYIGPVLNIAEEKALVIPVGNVLVKLTECEDKKKKEKKEKETNEAKGVQVGTAIVEQINIDSIKEKNPEFVKLVEDFATIGFTSTKRGILANVKTNRVEFRLNEKEELDLYLNNVKINDVKNINFTELFIMESADRRARIANIMGNLGNIYHVEFIKNMISENKYTSIINVGKEYLVYDFKSLTERKAYKVNGLSLFNYIKENFNYDVRNYFQVELNEADARRSQINEAKTIVQKELVELEESKAELVAAKTGINLDEENLKKVNTLIEKLEKNIVELKNHYVLLEHDLEVGAESGIEAAPYKIGDQIKLKDGIVAVVISSKPEDSFTTCQMDDESITDIQNDQIEGVEKSFGDGGCGCEQMDDVTDVLAGGPDIVSMGPDGKIIAQNGSPLSPNNLANKDFNSVDNDGDKKKITKVNEVLSPKEKLTRILELAKGRGESDPIFTGIHGVIHAKGGYDDYLNTITSESDDSKIIQDNLNNIKDFLFKKQEEQIDIKPFMDIYNDVESTVVEGFVWKLEDVFEDFVCEDIKSQKAYIKGAIESAKKNPADVTKIMSNFKDETSKKLFKTFVDTPEKVDAMTDINQIGVVYGAVSDKMHEYAIPMSESHIMTIGSQFWGPKRRALEPKQRLPFLKKSIATIDKMVDKKTGIPSELNTIFNGLFKTDIKRIKSGEILSSGEIDDIYIRFEDFLVKYKLLKESLFIKDGFFLTEAGTPDPSTRPGKEEGELAKKYGTTYGIAKVAQKYFHDFAVKADSVTQEIADAIESGQKIPISIENKFIEKIDPETDSDEFVMDYVNKSIGAIEINIDFNEIKGTKFEEFVTSLWELSNTAAITRINKKITEEEIFSTIKDADMNKTKVGATLLALGVTPEALDPEKDKELHSYFKNLDLSTVDTKSEEFINKSLELSKKMVSERHNAAFRILDSTSNMVRTAAVNITKSKGAETMSTSSIIENTMKDITNILGAAVVEEIIASAYDQIEMEQSAEGATSADLGDKGALRRSQMPGVPGTGGGLASRVSPESLHLKRKIVPKQPAESEPTSESVIMLNESFGTMMKFFKELGSTIYGKIKSLWDVITFNKKTTELLTSAADKLAKASVSESMINEASEYETMDDDASRLENIIKSHTEKSQSQKKKEGDVVRKQMTEEEAKKKAEAEQKTPGEKVEAQLQKGKSEIAAHEATHAEAVELGMIVNRLDTEIKKWGKEFESEAAVADVLKPIVKAAANLKDIIVKKSDTKTKAFSLQIPSEQLVLKDEVLSALDDSSKAKAKEMFNNIINDYKYVQSQWQKIIPMVESLSAFAEANRDVENTGLFTRSVERESMQYLLNGLKEYSKDLKEVMDSKEYKVIIKYKNIPDDVSEYANEIIEEVVNKGVDKKKVSELQKFQVFIQKLKEKMETLSDADVEIKKRLEDSIRKAVEGLELASKEVEKYAIGKGTYTQTEKESGYVWVKTKEPYPTPNTPGAKMRMEELIKKGEVAKASSIMMSGHGTPHAIAKASIDKPKAKAFEQISYMKSFDSFSSSINEEKNLKELIDDVYKKYIKGPLKTIVDGMKGGFKSFTGKLKEVVGGLAGLFEDMNDSTKELKAIRDNIKKGN